MKNIPVNRWTVGLVTALCLVFGADFMNPLLKAIGIMTAPYVPAA